MMLSVISANEVHFGRSLYSGKQRDTESTNDYFGARYYSSNVAARFLTPDWSAVPEPVPFADFENPQSLNLYGYVQNNPMSETDPDGHGCPPDVSVISADELGNTVVTVTGTGCTFDLPLFQTFLIPQPLPDASFVQQPARIGPIQRPPLVVMASDNNLKETRCIDQAVQGAVQDATGISLLNDLATAATGGSVAQFATPGYAAQGAQYTADAVASSTAAKAAIRTALRKEAVKVSTKAVGKAAAKFGKGLGAASLVLTADSAYEAYKACMAQ